MAGRPTVDSWTVGCWIRLYASKWRVRPDHLLLVKSLLSKSGAQRGRWTLTVLKFAQIRKEAGGIVGGDTEALAPKPNRDDSVAITVEVNGVFGRRCGQRPTGLMPYWQVRYHGEIPWVLNCDSWGYAPIEKVLQGGNGEFPTFIHAAHCGCSHLIPISS
jgi:hypothetical protein